MKLSELKASNSGFEKLTCTVKVDGKQLYPGALNLSRMHIDTTCELKTNTAEVLFCDITDAGEVMSSLQSGACLTIFGGYQKKEKLIFQGYVHTMTLRESGHAQLQELEIYAQDVKGLMMLHKRSAVESGKMKNALLQDILETPLYAEYFASLAMTPLPHSIDSIWPAMGCSDFDILEKLCRQALYTCYMRGDALHFEPRYTATGEMMELDAVQDVQQVELLYTIQDLIGTLTAASCDGYEEKKAVQESVTLSSLPYTKKLSGILKHTSTSVVDDGFHDIEELNYTVAGMKKEVENSYAKVNGQCVFLPWLQCGDELVLPKSGDGEKKKGYVTRVLHHIDDTSAYSEWEAVIEKG